jgi:hypothetical protein
MVGYRRTSYAPDVRRRNGLTRPPRITELDDERLVPALEALSKGHAFVFRGTGLIPYPDGFQFRAGIDKEPDQVTVEDAISVRNRAYRDVQELRDTFPDWAAALPEPSKTFVLYSYGTGGIEICRFDRSGMTWLLGRGRP